MSAPQSTAVDCGVACRYAGDPEKWLAFLPTFAEKPMLGFRIKKVQFAVSNFKSTCRFQLLILVE